MIENNFEEILQLLHDNQWIFKDAVTEILVKNSLQSLPEQWRCALSHLNYDELNNFVNLQLNDEEWPMSLQDFVIKCKKFTLPRELSLNFQLPKAFQRGLSPKKQHEVFYFTKLIHKRCHEAQIDTIVDLGAGLGYICQLLHYLHGYRVLGLESNIKNVKTARERQNSLYSTSLNDVKYICTTINEESADFIDEKLDEYFENVNEICLIGLHSCADLSVNACRLFATIKRAKICIILSCCYHKLTIDGDDFSNFPLSKTLKNIVANNFTYKDILNRPFLRLACQESASRWDKMSRQSHQQHALCVLARAVLELYADKNGYKLKKCVRKATRLSCCADFDTYLHDSLQRYTFNDEYLADDTKIRVEIHELWCENRDKLWNIEIYTALQLLLQSPAESLVLHDRRCWLMEQGFKTDILPIFHDNLSPRCHAIVAVK